MAGVLATATMVVHFAALIYIGFGGFLAWRWPRSIFVHVFFAAWGVMVNMTPMPCPLTALENHFRGLRGLGDLPGGFNDHYIFGPIIPEDHVQYVVVVALVVLVVSYAGAYALWRHRKSPSIVAAR